MNSMRKILVLAGLLVAACAHGQGLVANGNLETDLTGWNAVVQPGAKVALSNEKPAGGKSCLLLQTNGVVPAWVLAPEVSGAATGDLLNVTFAARRGQGQATLALNLVTSAAEVSDAVIWEAQLPADQAWHKVSLLLKLPPLTGPARLCFGALGLAGSWFIDDVDVQHATAPAASPATEDQGEVPVTNALSADWKPEGTLDATAQDIGGKTELLVNVNGIQVGVREELPCYRGYREGMVIYAVNRGELDKQLQVKVSAPPWIEAPTWTAPIGKSGTTRFHTGIQCLRQGETWIKVTFSSGSQEASLPVKVICQRSYPVFGALWHDTVPPDDLQAVLQLPLDMQVLSAAPDRAVLQPMAEAVSAVGSEYLVAPVYSTLTSEQYLSAVTGLASDLRPSFWLPCGEAEATTPADSALGLAQALRGQSSSGGMIYPPLTLRRDWQKGKMLPTKPALLTKDHTAGAVALACRLPVLGAPCVLSEQVDGKREVIGGAWASLTRQTDLSALRGLMAERTVGLPILTAGLHARSSGDERLDALYLARAITNCLYQGSTGVLLDTQRGPDNAFAPLPLTDAQGNLSPVPQVLRAMSHELAASVPLLGLAGNAEVSVTTETPVTYRPFLRGGEGIIVLWNNTSAPQDVMLEFRSQPVASSRLVLSYNGTFATRHWDPIMKFSEEAFKRNLPAVFIHLEPLQVQVHAYRLLDPHAAWIRNVSLAKPWVAPKEAPVLSREDRTWWKDMLNRRKTVN